MAVETLQLKFGTAGEFASEIDAGRLIGRFEAPAAISDVAGRVAEALAAPADFPPLHQGLAPGDRVTIIVDRRLPSAASVVAGAWREIHKREIAPEDVTILHPADFSGGTPADPRTGLPEDVRDRVQWVLHDPLKTNGCTYLATTAGGERIYLAREAAEADALLLAGCVEFDRLWGYRGLQSMLYPGLSTIEAIRKAHGQPHDELQVDDPRPLRQLAEEVAWLLGVQFGVAVLPSEGAGVSRVFAGQADQVMRSAVSELNRTWRFACASRPELVLVAVESDAAGQGWDQLARALHSARNLVARDGRIVVLTELDEALGPGLQMIRDSRKPRDAMRPLRETTPPDLLAATSLARSVEWANVYLLSRLDPDLVEELFMVPLSGIDEVARLIQGDERLAVVGSAQHVCTESAGLEADGA
ncbi:MAG: DUF2088 domain-containing protein [Planctomyces sp.]|nr:DUF2088 domain-containing protein [Planctomyces sp.]